MDRLELAIRQHLARYLAGTLTLNEFQDWFVPATWNVEQTASADVVDLVRDLELILAEATSGYMTRDELRADLARLTKRPPTKEALSA